MADTKAGDEDAKVGDEDKVGEAQVASNTNGSEVKAWGSASDHIYLLTSICAFWEFSLYCSDVLAFDSVLVGISYWLL